MTQGTEKTRRARESGGQRIAFFGGSFDPPHAGHLGVGRAARRALELDEVLFAPVGIQPLKRLDGWIEGASFHDRLEMTRLAVQDEPGFGISLLDAPTGADRPNFTAETLQKLKAESAPGSAIFCLIGADSFLQLSRWHRAAELPFLAGLIVAARPGEVLEPIARHLPPGLELFDSPHIRDNGRINQWKVQDANGRQTFITVLPDLHYEISATELRAAIQNREPGLLNGEKLLKPAVLDYITTHQLYR